MHAKRGTTKRTAAVDRRVGEATPKSLEPSAEQITRTPEYEAMLANIVAMIRAAKERGPIRPRITLRELRKHAQGEGVHDGR